MTDFETLLGGNTDTAPAPQTIEIWPETATTAALADLLGVSPRTLSELSAKGVLVKAGRGRWLAQESVRAYVDHLRQAASGRADGTTLTAERTRLAREQADKLELSNAATRGELLPRADVEAKWISVLTDVRAAMLAIPGRIAGRMALSPPIVAEIDAEVRLALKEAGNAA